jgi:hypothetical protein
MMEAHGEQTRQYERVVEGTDELDYLVPRHRPDELSIAQLDQVAAGNRDKDPWPDPPATAGQSLPTSVSK